MPKPKIYLGCALTNAPLEFREEIVKLREKIKEKYELIEFFSDPASVSQQSTELEYCQKIYEFDKNCVQSCDIMLAEVSYPSLGEGMELAFAVTNDKPILAVARDDASVSRMIMGITHPKFEFQRYVEVDDLLNLLEQFAKVKLT
jgi:nucleoside 2-deoxyribosyltransferase